MFMHFYPNINFLRFIDRRHSLVWCWCSWGIQYSNSSLKIYLLIRLHIPNWLSFPCRACRLNGKIPDLRKPDWTTERDIDACFATFNMRSKLYWLITRLVKCWKSEATRCHPELSNEIQIILFYEFILHKIACMTFNFVFIHKLHNYFTIRI